MALISLGVYLATLAPGLTWAHDSGDGGELAAAAHLLGIPHPPGYPTFVLAAHLFTLLPVGEIATRTNLFSAVCAAGASALLAWTVARKTDMWACGVAAGGALAFSPVLWSQATVTEVYALNGVFAALLLAYAAWTGPGAQSYSPSTLLVALAIGGGWGLSLGNHLTALFCAPLVLLALWRLCRGRAWGAIGLALGLGIYAYLPLRAIADPPINWGNPRTWGQFWWMVSGAPYRQFVFSLLPEHLLDRVLAWSGLVTRQFGWIGLMVTVLGARALWHADRSLLYATGTTVALCSIFAIGYNTTDSYLYLIPALVCLALWLGMGLNWVLSALASWRPWSQGATWVVTTLAICLPLAAAALRFSALDLSDDRAAYDFEARILERAPPKALILSQRDAHTFALWYFQYALGRRPDVVTIDLDLLRYEWYASDLSQRLQVELPRSLSAQDGQDLRRWFVALGRPVCQIEDQGTGLICTESGSIVGSGVGL